MNTPPAVARPIEVPMAPRKVKPDGSTYDENIAPVGRRLFSEPEWVETTFNIKPKTSTTTPFLEAFHKMSDDNKKKVTDNSFFRMWGNKGHDSMNIVINGVLDHPYKYSSEFKQFTHLTDHIIRQWADQYQVPAVAEEYLLDHKVSYDKFLALLDILGLEHPSEEYQALFRHL